jgi:hypothetical protein
MGIGVAAGSGSGSGTTGDDETGNAPQGTSSALPWVSLAGTERASVAREMTERRFVIFIAIRLIGVSTFVILLEQVLLPR